MKKILSLALVCIMMLSALTLTSCDEAYKVAESFVKEQLENFGVITRTTITEEEWLNTWNSVNFTVDAISEGLLLGVARTEDKFKIDMLGETIYIEKVDGKTFMIMEEEGAWYSMEAPSDAEDLWESSSMDDVVGCEFAGKFAELEYDEEKQVYLYSGEEYAAEFKFENGVLILGEIKDIDNGDTLTISNAGTTVVEIPEYTPYEGAGSTGSN